MSERRANSFAFDPPTGARLWHYLVAMLVVGLALAGGLRALDRATPADVASETQDAVLIDLPPTETTTHPVGDDAPARQAAAAAALAKPEDKAEPPKPASVELPKTTPPQRAAPASAPQAAHVSGGPEETRAESTDTDDAETHRVSAHLITLWQKALMARLQAARHGLPHHQRFAGLAKVAFEIDRKGHLVAEHVAQSSGSSALDAAALALVRLAEPYPIPPHEAGATQLSFVVPISFRP
jgi:protein TonB